jgi:cytochrome c
MRTRAIGGARIGRALWLLILMFSPADGLCASVTYGQTIVETYCARCHATGRAGDSPHTMAPPFRLLSRRYPIENLAEAFAEGIVTGHPDMPEFQFQPHEIDSILAYLQSLQAP